MQMKALSAMLIAASLLLTGCGDSDDSSGDVELKNPLTVTRQETTTATASDQTTTTTSAGQTTAAVTTAAKTETSSSTTTKAATTTTKSTAKETTSTKKTSSQETPRKVELTANKERYYYAQLDGFQRQIYNAMFEIISHTNEKNNEYMLDVPQDKIWDFADDFFMIYACINEDYPEFYYYDEIVGITWDYVEKTVNNGYYKIKIYQSQSYPNFWEELAEIQEAATEFLSDIDLSGSQFNVARRVHDKLLTTMTYDQNKTKDERDFSYAQTVYGGLLMNTAVCEGYSDTYSYLLRQCGILCLPIEGGVSSAETYAEAIEQASSPEANHTWNLARLDSKWYEIDVTWDDEDINDYSDYVQSLINAKEGLMDKRTHLYFARTTDFMRRTEVYDEFVYYTDEDGRDYSLVWECSVHIRASDPRSSYYSESGSYNYRALSEMLPIA